MLMECLAAGRSISLPALSTGAGKLSCRATGAYARIRQQFKTPIGLFDGVEEALTRIAGNTYMMEAARTLTATPRAWSTRARSSPRRPPRARRDTTQPWAAAKPSNRPSTSMR